MPGPSWSLSLVPVFTDLSWPEVAAIYLLTGVLTLAIFVLPVMFVWGAHAAWRDARRQQLEHRARLHLCTHCGYDLRASTDRCPECGHPIRGATPVV